MALARDDSLGQTLLFTACYIDWTLAFWWVEFWYMISPIKILWASGFFWTSLVCLALWSLVSAEERMCRFLWFLQDTWGPGSFQCGPTVPFFVWLLLLGSLLVEDIRARGIAGWWVMFNAWSSWWRWEPTPEYWLLTTTHVPCPICTAPTYTHW